MCSFLRAETPGAAGLRSDGVAAVQLSCLLYRLIHIFLVVPRRVVWKRKLSGTAFSANVCCLGTGSSERSGRQLLLQFIVTPRMAATRSAIQG